MGKKIYDTPIIEITAFDSGSITSLTVSAVQMSYKKTSAANIGNTNAIDF